MIDFTCPPGTDCCYQKGEGDQRGNHGTCVAPGSCNYETGHPTNNYVNECPIYVEGYNGDEDDMCNNFKFYMSVLLITILFTLGFILYYNLKNN
jgi:hypothetical protein